MSISTKAALVSVIIPTYNRESILGNAIKSAIGQTYSNIQIIIVDDGSTDNTRTLVSQYPQVDYIYQEHGGGQGKARNTGLKHARGLYIASLDSDDVWEPDFLERCVYKLEKDDLDFVFSNWTQAGDDNETFNFFAATGMLDCYAEPTPDNWIDLNNDQLRKVYIEMCPSPSSSFVFRASSVIDKWNEQVNIADDWCLLLDMVLLNNAKSAFTFDLLWFKNIDGKNIFDGRHIFDVLELLYIKDITFILKIYGKLLTEKEKTFLKDKIAKHTYLLFLFKLTKAKITHEDLGMLKKALGNSPGLFFKVAYMLIVKKIEKQSNKLTSKLKSLKLAR